MTTATMAVTEGMYLVDPSQEGFPPKYESHNLVLKHITLEKKGYYVRVGKAAVTNYTPEIVFPQFNIFSQDPYNIIDFSQVSLLPYYQSSSDLSSTIAYLPYQTSVTVMGWFHHKNTQSETIYFGFAPIGEQSGQPPSNAVKVMVYNYSLFALLIDDFALQEDHHNFVNGKRAQS
jgi:hypothetical protein